jgi:hypothetical protein
MTRNRLYSLVLILGVAGLCWTTVSYIAMRHGLTTPTICLFRKITGLPCPSCGTVHSIFLIMRGEFLMALRENPLGFAGVLMVLVFPLWIFSDLVFRRNSFFIFYQRMEQFLKQKIVAIPLILLILGIWIWKLTEHCT